MTSEFEFEPVRGLPERLPPGETILWQGTPNGWMMARSAFHLLQAAAYFALLLGWFAFSSYWDGQGAVAIAWSAIPLIGISAIGLLLLGLLGWLTARTTVYTITNRRVVFRIGIALTMAINIPYRQIASAGFRKNRDGSGDITLQLTEGNRIAYLNLWPHARAWRFSRPEPMLRAIPKVDEVADILALALEESLVDQPVKEQTPRPADSHDVARPAQPVAAE